MSIKKRLIVSFSLMVLLSVLLGSIFIGVFWLLRTRYVDYEYQRKLYDMAADLKAVQERSRHSLDGFLLGLDSEKDHFSDITSEINQMMAQWKTLVADKRDDKEEERRVESRIVGLWSSLEQVFTLVENSRRSDAIQVVDNILLPVMDGIDRDLRVLVYKRKGLVSRSWESAQSLASRTVKFSILLLIAVFLVGAGFTIIIYQSVTQPLAKLRESTRKVAKGEWNLKLDFTEPEELAELARSFEAMANDLSSLQAQVVQMDRMSAIGTLAGGVAHEINNPLSGVLGQAQLLLDALSPNDPNRRNAEKIERAAQRCRKIVRGLLDFARPQDYLFSPADVDSVIASALALCETETAASNINIKWEKNPKLPKIWVSDSHLQQVFLNIISNAMHAMPKGGTLTIRSMTADIPGKIILKTNLQKANAPSTSNAAKKEDILLSGSVVETSFSDTGCGIENKHLAHIFDPFFTTKEPGKGTGLGLSISYGIVKKHNGEIDAYSDGPGFGSTFTVRIPAVPSENLPEPEINKNTG